MKHTRTVSTKLTPEQHDDFLSRAVQAGVKPGVFCRDLLIGDQEQLLRHMLAEIREMRTILFEIVHAALSKRELTNELVRAIVANAEATKFAKADQVLERRKVK